MVQLDPDLPELSPGHRATFFADPLIYGETLVVQEVGRSEEPEAMGRTRGGAEELGMPPVRAMLNELAEESALEHARSADAVVRGHVIALRATASAPQHEHDPQWWVATLDVDVVAHGDVPGVGDEGGEVDVRYANSLDRRWRQWPKPKAGQSGMWVLHRVEEDGAEAPFQLMDPEDLQPSLLLDALLGEAAEEDEDEDGES